jgi:hypothetical protein
MLSLHDLRAPAVALDWHEAVAVVASLTAVLIDSGAEACPAPNDVELLVSGEVRVSGPRQLTGAPAPALAGVLGALLDASPCPAELRQLAASYEADSRTGSEGQDALAALYSALAFYERPGRQGVLATLAGRAEAALELVRRADALEALTERTRVAAGAAPRAVEPGPQPADAEPAGLEQEQWETTAPESPWRLLGPAAAAVVVFVGMAYLAATWFGDRPAPRAAPSAEVAEELPISRTVAAPPDATTPSARSIPPAEQTASPGPGRTVPPRLPAQPRAAPPPAGASRSASAGARVAPAAAAVGPAPGPDSQGGVTPRRSIDVAVAERDGRVVAQPAAPAHPGQATHPAPAGRVFTSSDPQVTPAVLIRPHLPEQPPPEVPDEQVGTLEFVVTESGAVEHVHLISPANRYQERMLVAAAKTWQFRPATRDGRPVRFRTRIRVTL